MLFPQLSPQYYNETDKAILSKMETFYAESITINQSFWSEADTDTRFEAGDQTLWNDLYGNLPANRRRQFNFNRIRRVVNTIDGHQRRNRKSIIATPGENADADTADQFTKIFMWLNEQEGVLHTVSDAFHGALVTGMNLLQVWVDYRSDPVSGNIRVDNCSYNSFLIDPYFRKSDLSDCNSIWKRTFLTKREVLSLLPAHTEEIMGMVGGDNGTGRDGKFQFMPESYNYGMKNLMTYDEFYYRDYRLQRMLVDAETGETQEWRGQDEERLEEFLKLYPSVTVIDQEIPTVKLAIVVQGKVMYDGPNPMGIDVYPFVPVLGYYNPQMPYFPWRIQGVVRGLRDAQFLYNRRKVIELDSLESQINSGWKYKEDALVDPHDIYLTSQGRGLALKKEAAMTDVEQIAPVPVMPTTIELSKILGDEINEVAGVSEELMGFDNKESLSGYHAALKMSSSTTTLQILFDQLDKSQQLLGRIFRDIVQSNFTPGKVKKILEGEEPAPQFYNKAFGTYNISIEEGLNTTTQKQMYFGQLLQLRESGVPVPDEALLEACTIQNKKKLIESIQQAQQAQQQSAQQAQQLQMAQLEADIEESKARAFSHQGSGLERISRVDENHALALRQEAEARADDDMGFLNKIKALKEIDQMDIQHIAHLLDIERSLKEKDKEATESTRTKESRVKPSVV